MKGRGVHDPEDVVESYALTTRRSRLTPALVAVKVKS
jgi:hypothetical protein